MKKKVSLVKKRATRKFITPSDLYYLDMRKKSLITGVSKALVIPYVINYLHRISDRISIVPSVLDLGCGEGHILSHIKKAMEQSRPSYPVRFVGVDYNQHIISKAKELYPTIDFIQLDIANNNLKKKLKREFDIVMTVNTLHEVFTFNSSNSSFNEEKGKKAVIKTLKGIVKILKKGGKFIFFDGVEYKKEDLRKPVRIKLLKREAIENLKTFEKTYKPIVVRIEWHSRNEVTMDVRTFVRFITKTIFLNTPAWNLEQEETYQYFNKNEFEEIFKKLKLNIEVMNLLSPNLGIWKSNVEILTPNIHFPDEHIMIIASKTK